MNPVTNKDNQAAIKAKIEVFRTQCRQAGLRVTPQREAVYEALLQSDQHPSAEAVFRHVRQTFPSISLDTVNRTLLTLSEMGTAFIVEGSGEAKRFDANLDDHQHFKCIKCRRIVDIDRGTEGRVAVPENLPDGFTVLRATVYIEGLCDLCGKDSN